MKIVVIGGTGLIGSKVITNLRERGDDAVAAAPNTGVNTITGEGLDAALTGAQVVVDLANSPSFEDAAVLEFFETSGRNLLKAEVNASVEHHVALSVVGADLLPDSGYLRAKVAQEQLIEAAGQPYTIIRSTQFFEFRGPSPTPPPTATRPRFPPPTSSRSPPRTSPQRSARPPCPTRSTVSSRSAARPPSASPISSATSSLPTTTRAPWSAIRTPATSVPSSLTTRSPPGQTHVWAPPPSPSGSPSTTGKAAISILLHCAVRGGSPVLDQREERSDAEGSVDRGIGRRTGVSNDRRTPAGGPTWWYVDGACLSGAARGVDRCDQICYSVDRTIEGRGHDGLESSTAQWRRV